MKEITLFGFLCFLLLTVSSCSSKARLQKIEMVNSSSLLLNQSYTQVFQSNDCGDEPAVRFVSFTYDKRDSLKILIDITTSTSEEEIDGSLVILIDDFELDYANVPKSKLYTETFEVEVQDRYPSHIRNSQQLIGRIIASAIPNGSKKVKELQYWNSTSIQIEKSDILLLIATTEIEFIIPTRQCDLHIIPSKSQIFELNNFLWVEK
jgi:hypothetical protein